MWEDEPPGEPAIERAPSFLKKTPDCNCLGQAFSKAPAYAGVRPPKNARRLFIITYKARKEQNNGNEKVYLLAG